MDLLNLTKLITEYSSRKINNNRWKMLFLPSATKLRRLCFYRHLSVHRGNTWPGTPPGLGTPPWGRHPSRDQVHTTPDQVHPPGTRYTLLGADTPPGTRYTPSPGPGTPPNQVTPLEHTPPGTRYTPQNQVHPPGPGTPVPRDKATASDGTHPTGMHSCSVEWILMFWQ